MIPAHVAIKSSTQQFIEIEEIKDDLAILRDGSACVVIKVNAVNFGLLSESEQDAMIYAYAGLLNSLSFSVQIVIRSKRKDITGYLNLLKDQENKQLYGPLKEQIKKYRIFVETTVRVNNVLDKKFYIVIPFSPLELGVGHAMGLLSPKKKGLPYPLSYIMERAKTTLYPKRDHLLRQMTRIGLKAYQLTTAELIQLFYDVYNPGSLGTEGIGAIAPGLMAPLVEAQIQGNAESKTTQPTNSTAPIFSDIPTNQSNNSITPPAPTASLLPDQKEETITTTVNAKEMT